MIEQFIVWLKHKLHRCSKPGCWAKGMACFYPNGADALPDEWVCAEHCHDAGYCRCCGNFWAGVDSFDFSRNGLCENCNAMLGDDSVEFDIEDGDFDEYGPL